MAEAAPPGTVRAITGQRTIDLDAMSRAERDELGRQLYRVHCTVFAGVSEDGFLCNVLNPPAERNLIRLFLDERGDVIGYCAVHRFRRAVSGREHVLIRAEAGLLPEYRGRGSTYWFGMVTALRYKLRHPFVRLHYLGTLVHPSSYHLFSTYFPVVYPAPGRAMPRDIRDLATALIDSFQDPAVDPSDPFVRDVGWITIETPNEAALCLGDAPPDVLFFRDRNPGYINGHGLLVLIPLGFPNLVAALFRRGVHALRDRIRRGHPRF